MNHYQLAQAHHQDLLCAAAQQRQAAQARQARAAHRPPTMTTPARRLARLWQRPASA